MIDLKLEASYNKKDIKKEPIRAGFSKGLLAAGTENTEIVAACADLTTSTGMNLFAEAFPDRFVEVGVAEQNLVTVGSGLAAIGKVPFVSSYAAFSPGRNWEQIRTTICLNDQPVKVVGSHAGISVGPDGATHQMLEDIALMRVLPNMVVVVPGDSLEAERATIALAKDSRPAYLRLAREATPIITTKDSPFVIGKAYLYRQGNDISLMTTGTMTYQALVAADNLIKKGISVEVLHIPTIKPLDTVAVLASAKKTKRIITVEEAQIAGGLGSVVAEFLSEEAPTKIHRMGIKDRFGESGKPDELLEHFGLTSKHIELQIHRMLIDK